MMPLLTIEDLCIYFVSADKTTHAVKNVSFNIYPGKTTALVGESGSGKSVTSLCMLQLLPKNITRCTGKILFHDNNAETDLLHTRDADMQHIRGNRIAMIFQEPMTSLNPVKHCGEQVAEAIRLHRKTNKENARRQTLELFSAVQLPDVEATYKKYPHQLSGGQKQRVMIAMAMSCNPALLICDEPTTALDVTVQKNIVQLIKDLQQQYNLAVLFITHDLGLVSEIADEIVVMYQGKVEEKGSKENILRQPRSAYTKALLACRPVLYKHGQRLPVVADFLNNSLHSSATVTTQHATQKELLLRVGSLTVTYPLKQSLLGRTLQFYTAVNNVDLDIYKGETIGLVGESGCGKTTLGRTLMGLVIPTSGQILYKGKDITLLKHAERKALYSDVQLIFQDPYATLNPSKKAGEAITEVMQVHRLYKTAKQRKEKAVELLLKTGLDGSAFDKYPHEFSGGQRQRIVIARALAVDPSFIICDESVSALDVSVQAQILNLLNDLKTAYNFTILFISHDLSVIRYLSDRVLVMRKGSIVETGTAEQVWEHPAEKYTQELLAAIPGRTTM